MEDDINIPSVLYLHTPKGVASKYKDRAMKKDPDWVKRSITYWSETETFEISLYLQQQGVTIKEGELYLRDLEEPVILKEDIKDMLAKITDGKMFLNLYKRLCSTCHVIFYYKNSHHSMPLHQNSHATSSFQRIPGTATSNFNLVMRYMEGSSITSEPVNDHLTIKDNSDTAQTHQIRLKNISNKTITIRRIVVNNSQVSDSLFTEKNGIKTGHMITYKLQVPVTSGEISKEYIELFVKNKVNSADHKVTIITEDEKGKEYKETKTISIFKLYENRDYDSNMSTRVYQDWKTGNSEDSETTQLNHKSYICANDRTHNTHYQKLINELNIGLIKAEGEIKDLKASPEALQLFNLLNVPLNRNNFLFNTTMLTLAEMYHYLQSQICMEAKVLSIVPTETGDLIKVNINYKDAGKTNIQVGDQILIKPKPKDCPEVVLVGDLDCKEATCIQVKMRGSKDFEVNQTVAISTKIRTQPYLVLLHSLQVMEKDQATHTRVLNYLLPATVKTPKEYPKIDCPNKKFNPGQTTAFQKIDNHLPGDPGFCLRGPAGTGKTNTFSENVVKDVEDGKTVLIVCPTNNGLNDIQERVVTKFADKNISIVKLGSKNTPVTNFCNTHCIEELTHGQRGHKMPGARKIKGARIVISTIHNCIRLRCLILDGALYDKCFDIIYIDEAGYALLSTLIIPLVTQIRSGNPEFKLIFIGDEKQIRLTPRSMLGRVCATDDCDILSRSTKSLIYDEQVNPQISHFLTDNYRNPRLVIKELNSLCYDNLNCHSDIEGKIVFYHIDTSYGNVKDVSRYSIPEIQQTLEIASLHKGERVSCISYYASNRSVTFIEAYNKRIFGPSFSTCETVQGQECDHAIIALCCPKNNNLWHNNPNRLNVCLSRGKKTVSFITNLFHLSRTTLFKPLMRRAMFRGQIEADERTLDILRVNLRTDELVETK